MHIFFLPTFRKFVSVCSARFQHFCIKASMEFPFAVFEQNRLHKSMVNKSNKIT